MGAPLRIALVSPQASPLSIHGAARDAEGGWVAQVARWLSFMGHKVDVLTRRDDPTLPTVVDVRPGVRVRHIDAGPATPLSMAAQLAHVPEFTRGCQALLRHGAGYDLVHANGLVAGLVARHLKEALGLPYAVTFHTLGLAEDGRLAQADGLAPTRADIEQRVVDNADALIAQCPQEEFDLTRLYQADPRRLHLVPCGVDVNAFAPMNRQQARDELGLDAEDFIALHLDQVREEAASIEDVDNIMRSLSHLPAEVPARLLVVVGEAGAQGPRSTRLRLLADEHGVHGKVMLMGPPADRDFRLHHAAADVLVATPPSHGFCTRPLEAMACGTPVVASHDGALPYSVTDGVTGYLVPPREPDVLAGCLAHLHANPRLATAMGRAGMHRVRSLFTWERVARLLLATYEDVLHKARHAPAAVQTAEWEQAVASAACPAQKELAAVG